MAFKQDYDGVIDLNGPLLSLIRSRETGGGDPAVADTKYNDSGADGIVGAYQFRAPALQTLGAIRQAPITNDANWTGVYGDTLAEFTNSHLLQDDAAADYASYIGKFLNDHGGPNTTYTDPATGHVIPLTQDGLMLAGWLGYGYSIWYQNGGAAGPGGYGVNPGSNNADALIRLQEGAVIDGKILGYDLGTKFNSDVLAVEHYLTSKNNSVLHDSSNQIAGSITTAGGNQTVAVVLDAGKSYEFDLVLQSGGGGSLASGSVLVLNSTGTSVGQGQSQTGGYYVTKTSDTTGLFYVKVSAASGTSGTYTLKATALDDAVNNTTTTTAVPIGGSISKALEAKLDADEFSVSLTGGTTYRFIADGAATGGGNLAAGSFRLLDATHAIRTVGLGTAIDYTPTATGKFYLSVAGSGTNVGSYKVSASMLPSAAPFASDEAVDNMMTQQSHASPNHTLITAQSGPEIGNSHWDMNFDPNFVSAHHLQNYVETLTGEHLA